MPIRREFRKLKLLRAFKLRRRAHEGTSQKWICGRLRSGKACRVGPTRRGKCQATYECVPAEIDGTWRCRRSASNGGQCQEGPLPDGTCCNPIPACTPVRSIRATREAFATWLAVLVIGLLVLTITYVGDTKFLMPGPITTAHSSIGKCGDCHSNVAGGKFGWLHALVASARPDEDSAACLTCHKMGSAALNPHGLGLTSLEVSTERLQAVAASSPVPTSARVRNTVFPVKGAFADGVFCATCHKEHKGETFDLKAMANARCHSCHTVQFNSFQKDHPNFENYPFRRRTRINFDHGSHFGEHFPKTRAKDPQSKSTPGACADCHTSGPEKRHMGVKGFAQICASCHLDQIIGAERATGPKGIALLTLPGLDVATLEEKKAAIGQWPQLSEAEITPMMKLLIGWDEDGRRLLEKVGKLDLLDLSEASDEDIATVEKFVWRVKDLIHALSTAKTSDVMKRLGSATGARLDPSLIAKLTAAMPRDVLMSAQREWLPDLPAEMARRGRGARTDPAARPGGATDASRPTQVSLARKNDAEGAKEDKQRDETVVPAGPGRLRINVYGEIVRGSDDRPPGDDRSDDDGESPSNDKTEVASDNGATVAIDAESWAEFGGWYRQEFAILYKPAGHADGFLRAWLDFTGRLYGKADSNLASPVFDMLTAKDAQGQCTKCHSVDAAKEGDRKIKWAPSSIATRASRFTSFAHEPHFGLIGERGCLTCHDLSGAAGYQNTYKAHDPTVFVSNFKLVQQNQCASCHKKNAARDDCLLCHKYHVNDVTTPITATKIPDK